MAKSLRCEGFASLVDDLRNSQGHRNLAVSKQISSRFDGLNESDDREVRRRGTKARSAVAGELRPRIWENWVVGKARAQVATHSRSSGTCIDRKDRPAEYCLSISLGVRLNGTRIYPRFGYLGFLKVQQESCDTKA